VKHTARVVTFGELLLRLDPKGYDRFVQANEFVARYTGAEANVAVSLAIFGVEAFAVSKVPAHEIGQACINFLRRFGVNTDHIARGGERLGVLFVETGASQRPSQVIYDRSHSSIREVNPAEFDWESIFAGKNWFHFSGTAPALGSNTLAVLEDALRTAQRLGVTVSCDCNYRSKLWSREDASRVLTRLMKNVNVFVGTRYDAELLFGIKPGRGGKGNGDDRERRMCAESAKGLQELFGFSHVAFTLRTTVSASVNRIGGLLCDGKKLCVSRPYEMLMIDRVGGGDAFTAGLIYGLLTGCDAQRTIDFATAAACLKHTIPGDFNLASKDEVEQLMAGDGGGRIRR
jgi:2-dehydro-3-deoxygluconokinase